MNIDTCLAHAEELSSLVVKLAERKGCDCLLLSGGVDTAFVSLSLALSGLKPKSITVVYDSSSPDYRYASIVAANLGLSHVVVHGNREEIEACLGEVLAGFRTIDPIEVVCDIPICLGLRKALAEGCTCVLTGDGGDELFLGYSFLAGLDTIELEKWLERVMAKGPFSSEVLGSKMGIDVVPALFSGEVLEYSGRVPLECKLGFTRSRKWGKLLLRLFLDHHGLSEVAWREKTPINLGSGFGRLLEEWATSVKETSTLYSPPNGMVVFPSKAHLYLYLKLRDYSIEPPGVCDDRRIACPICMRCMRDGHCPFCGASLDREGVVSIYRGD